MSNHRGRSILGIAYVIFASSLCFASILFNEHSVSSYYNNPWSAVAVDLDRDNDIDIVGSGRLGHRISWWENNGNFSFIQHDISNISYYAMVVNTVDIDNDSDIDILCASQNNGVELWINQGNQTFVRQIIANWPYSSYLDIADVDSDGDMDVLDCCCEGGVYRMGWIENIENAEVFVPHIVADSWNHSNSAGAADIDSDGDIDLIGTASYAGEVAWFENDGNESFTKHIILSSGTRPSCASARDIDGDGDCDVAATLCLVNKVVWFENNGSEQFTMHDVDYNFARPHQVRIIDLDNDADQDFIASAIDSDQIAWWEHIGNNPVQWSKHIITNSFNGATGIDIKDIDRDGDLDVLGAAQFGNNISWWENIASGIEENNNISLNRKQKIATLTNRPIDVQLKGTIKVYDIRGKVVTRDNLKNGIYFIKYENAPMTKIIKIQ